MSIDLTSPNLILLYYPPFAGGKFVSNSLSLSRYCILPDIKFAPLDLGYTTFDNSYYEFKLNAVLSTLPPPDQVRNWRRYEFKEYMIHGLYNNDYGEYELNYFQNFKFTPLLENLLKSNRDHCFVSHYHNVALGFKSVWANCKIITLVNWFKFIKIAGTLKHSENEDIIKHLDYLIDHQTSLPHQSYIFDVDNSMFNRRNYLLSMKILYDGLGYDDHNPDLLSKYYDEYRFLHGF